jgi:glyoxylase-like metal-dependent hydrolase (beta-lactamase superfamily II)
MSTQTTPIGLGVNVFTAPGKPIVGTTVSEATALAEWVALHQRNLTTIYVTHGHFDHFYGLSVLIDRFPDAKAIATAKSVELIEQTRSRVGPLTQKMFPGQLPREDHTARAALR